MSDEKNIIPDLGISKSRGEEIKRLYGEIKASMKKAKLLYDKTDPLAADPPVSAEDILAKLKELQSDVETKKAAYEAIKSGQEKIDIETAKAALLDKGVPLSKNLRQRAMEITEEARKIDLANTGIKAAALLVKGDLIIEQESVSQIVEYSQKARTESQKLASEARGFAATATGIIASARKDAVVQGISSAATAAKETARSNATVITKAYKSLVPLTDTKVLKETYAELGRLKDELERISNIVKDKDLKGLDFLPDGTLGNANDYININIDRSTATANGRKTRLYEYFSKKFPFTYLQYTKDEPTVNNYKPSDDVVMKALIEQSKKYLPPNIKTITDPIQDAIDETNVALKKANDSEKQEEAQAIKKMVGGDGEKGGLLQALTDRITAIDALMSKIKEKVTPDKKTRPAQNGPEKAAEGISDPEFKVVSRVFPAPFVNSKGFRIGNYHVIVNTDKLPFGSTDEADHFLYNLFDYINYEGTPKTSRKMARKIKDFFKHKEVDLTAFLPIKYPDPFQEEFLRQQQVILMEENKKLRKNLRKLKNELAGFSYSDEDAKLRKEAFDVIEKDVGIKREVDNGKGGPIDPQTKEKASKKLAAYIDAIDEEEGLLEGEAPEYKPALLQERAKGAALKGGSKKKRTRRKPPTKNRRTKRRKHGK